MTTLAGVDGCARGWVVVTSDDVRVVSTFAEVVQLADVVGVDMPVGLPSTPLRTADVDARRYLSPRGATIFPTPPRPLLAHDTYAAANAFSKQRFGRGLTRQTFNLFAKLRQVDAVVDAATQDTIIEVHPECSFRALTGVVLPSKHTAAGRAARVDALRPVFGEVSVHVVGARPDDVLDAYAVLWTVRRFVAGTHLVHGDGARDERGLVMRIVT